MNTIPKKLNQKSWWSPIWRGLIVDPEAKHYRQIRSALWLFLYLILHADRKTGELHRRYDTISRDLGIPKRTVRRWLALLDQAGYVEIGRTRRSPAFSIRVRRWKAFDSPRSQPDSP
jgi:hypothetical protein